LPTVYKAFKYNGILKDIFSMTSSDIRQEFLNFFKSKGHTIVPSAPIVVKNDPTLLFTNAGMNQFKDYFLGNKQPEYKRIADTQKCLRVSGKHNDLEEVGVDTYHHTMFEMLGNWSFGDYFKKEAIAWSWELLTEVYKLDKDRLYVTIFEGDEKEGLAKDEEAFNEWKKYVPEERILMGNKKDNFWEMGDTGPCGPSSEIHYDSRSDERRKLVDGANLVNADNPQVIEIWNNVFIQFNRLKDGSLEPLPAKNVDTGMGFERLVRVIQGKQSNYDTDVFSGTIAAIEKITAKQYDGSDNKQAIAFRVLADHVRAIAFTIADGQLPSNTGAGYVIRRILRRAVRYYYSYLDYKQPLLFQLIPVIGKQFENVFPELQQQIDFVSKVVKEEEDAFLRTLEKGIRIFENYVSTGTAFAADRDELYDTMDLRDRDRSYRENKIISGSFSFKLNDTYGFPIDLTELMAREIGWTVDMQGFQKELQQQKNRSRAATALDTEDWVVLDDNNAVKFVGYDSLETKARVLKYRKVKAKGKEAYQIVLDKTPFYAESGGQVGDKGVLKLNDATIEIIDTKKENDLIIHVAETIPDDLSGEVVAIVPKERRQKIALHHSATHLLHAALRKVLGTHVAQKGSLVNDEYLRFDFSHFAKVTDEELAQIEAIVNERIRANIPVVIKNMSKEEAMQSGAMALFGEKYGDVVRVVTIDPNYSVELCGGTHVGATGELGFFKIKHETAVAAGVRRIEAVTGKAAEGFVDEQLAELNAAKATLKNPKQLSKSIEGLLSEQSELKKKLESLEAKLLNSLEGELVQQATTVNNIPFIGETVDVSSADALKKLSNDLSKKTNGAVVLCASINGKASVAVALAERVVGNGLDANKIIKEQVAPLIKGGGGGQKTLATAGGQDSSNFQQVIDKVKGLL
jgi:alanyl-tRNA synthetase